MSSKPILNDRRISLHDFALAVTLLCKGYELIEFRLQPNSQCVYFFAEDAGIKKTVDNYRKRKCLVEPCRYMYTATWLQQRLLEGEGDEN